MEDATIYINGVVGEDITLLDVIRQINSYSSFGTLNVHINSVGGDFNQGFAIYDYLVGLKSKHKVTTRATGDVMSIATVIYMAGEERYAENSAIKNFMLHLPWAEARGTAQDFKDYSSLLDKAEKDLKDFYVKNLKNVDEKTITNLLETDLFLNADEAFDMGIVTNLEIPFKAVAKFNINNKEEKDNFMSKFEEKVNAIFNKLFPKAEKEIQDATGVTILFPDVEVGEEVEKGDKATIDGAPANGEYVMPDGSTYVFSDGELESIKEAETTEEETTEEEVVAEAEEGEIISMEEIEKILQMLNKNITSIAELSEANNQLKMEIKNLKKSVGSDFEIDDEVEEKKGKKKKISRAAQIMRS
ncbi:Clp protease ClpP [Galbibacter sp. BG1]